MTAIEWCHRPGTVPRTWNPTKGCSRVSEGCRHCYAEQQAARIVRMGKGKFTIYNDLVKTVGGEARWTGKVVLVPEVLAQPLKWREPSTVFVNSMSDLFHESLTNEQIAAVFGVMAACPQHTFIILTKRAKRLPKWYGWAEETGDPIGTCLREAFCTLDAANTNLSVLERAARYDRPTVWPLRNVWMGVSVENQEAADERIPELLSIPAVVRLLSCEPLLEDVSLFAFLRGAIRNEALRKLGAEGPLPGIDWVIAGCESGKGARPCDVAWLRSLRDQCKAAGVPIFLKQAEACNDDRFWETEIGGDDFHSIQDGPGSKRKASGVIGAPYLDGVQHLEFPKAA